MTLSDVLGTGDPGPPPAGEAGANDGDGAASSADLVLYINCLATKGGVNDGATPLEQIIAEHAAPICAEEGVADLRLIPYAQGKGMLAASLRANPPRGLVVARTGELSDVAIEALRPLAAKIVEGVR